MYYYLLGVGPTRSYIVYWNEKFSGDSCQPQKIATLSKTGDTNRNKDGTQTHQLQVTTTVSWKLVNLKSEREYGGIEMKKAEKEEEEFDISGIDLNADDGWVKWSCLLPTYSLYCWIGF